MQPFSARTFGLALVALVCLLLAPEGMGERAGAVGLARDPECDAPGGAEEGLRIARSPSPLAEPERSASGTAEPADGTAAPADGTGGNAPDRSAAGSLRLLLVDPSGQPCPDRWFELVADARNLVPGAVHLPGPLPPTQHRSDARGWCDLGTLPYGTYWILEEYRPGPRGCRFPELRTVVAKLEHDPRIAPERAFSVPSR